MATITTGRGIPRGYEERLFVEWQSRITLIRKKYQIKITLVAELFGVCEATDMFKKYFRVFYTTVVKKIQKPTV